MSRLVAIILTLTILPSPTWSAPPSFEGLGRLQGNVDSYSTARSISADGRTIVGWTHTDDNSQLSYRWSSMTGMVGLGDLAGGGITSTAEDVSKDGRVIVGFGSSALGYEAFKWTTDTGMTGLGAGRGSNAVKISADGRIIVGLFQNASTFRVQDGVLTPLFEGEPATARALSSDGQFITAAYINTIDPALCRTFRWKAPAATVCLPDPLPGNCCVHPYAISGDGRVIVGSIHHLASNVTEAFRWTEATGLVPMSSLPDFTASAAIDVSLDGTVIVGIAWSAAGDDAFIWSLAEGMRSLRTILENDHGLDLTNWPDLAATCVSANGLIIAGDSIDTAGLAEPWIAHLPQPPCPVDLNCDGMLDLGDITPFTLALTDTYAYAAAFPLCGWARADANDDGGVDGADIAPFVAAVLAGPCPF